MHSYDLGGVLLSTKREPTLDQLASIISNKRTMHALEPNW